MSQSPADVARLSPAERRELLARLLAERDAATDEFAPCSYNQRSLWFMDQLAPSSTQQNVTVAWRVRSTMDGEALRRALRALVARHEVLRTTYETRDGEPWQRIRRHVPDGFDVRIMGACDEATLREAVQSDGARLFDLEHGPLLRATLFTRGPTDHVLLFAIHHIACDLWSLEHMHTELRELYGREIGAADASATPLEPPRAYREFTVWQRDMLAGADGEAHWDYWRTKLGGTLPRLAMPLDHPRPPVQSFARDTVRFVIPRALIPALRRRASEEQTTLFTLFLAAFECLLHRYTGQDEILVGSAASGRSRREFEAMVGYFVNTIVFRADFASDPTFREVLRRARVDVLQTLEHQDFSLEMVVERLRVPRDPSRAPIADANIVWDKTRDPGDWFGADPGERQAIVRMDWYGAQLETYPLDQGGAPTDIGIVVFEIGQTISVNMWYATDLFDRSTVERIGGHFVTLLEAVARDPGIRVSCLPLATAGELAEIAAGDAAARPVSGADTLLDRFEAVVRRTPAAVAATGGHGHLTYGELDARAAALGARLRACGVQPGHIVGLRVARDVELVVGVLGILKAGAAYLPIDTTYPDSRAAFMLADSGAAALVTERALAHALADVVVPRVFADAVESAAAPERDAAAPRAGADDLAYVIYTSGSTGQPKGVMVTHRNVMRLFDATAPWFAFGEHDVWSLFHSIAFDFSVWELWGALLHGGRVVVVPYAVTRAPDEFLEVLARERVTMLSQTPSAFRQLVAADQARLSRAPFALRVIVFGGEALDVHALRPWLDRYGDERPRLVNMYGITETTVHTTYRPITIDDLHRRARSPIGRALPDLSLHVLDAAGQPVPVGVPGELYVGGAGVARGYLNRPELTEARFRSDPSGSGGRLYRSGDLVRRLAGGDIEYLGRIDQQVKIRGFRIELGEIERALARHASVAECAVVVRPGAANEPRITAYVVARAQVTWSSADLQSFLRQFLPDYMVPSAFIRVDALPLTSNHKLDVNALPLPEQVESASTRDFVPPGNDVERAIAAEWVRMLGVSRVGIADDFFELGGHSILATGLAHWIRDRFHVRFPVHAVFESPTVAGMAQRVATLTSASTMASAPREEFEL